MGKRKSLIDKQIFKKAQGACRICGENDYAVLDIHRIKAGKDNGRYTKFNSVTLCCLCHRKVHDNQITIDKYYLSTGGIWALRIVIDGEEKFV